MLSQQGGSFDPRRPNARAAARPGAPGARPKRTPKKRGLKAPEMRISDTLKIINGVW